MIQLCSSSSCSRGLSIIDVDTNKSYTRSGEGYLVLLRSPSLVLLLTSHFLLHLGIFAAFHFTYDRAAVEFGLGDSVASLLLSTMGAANCVGRVVWGRLLDRWEIQRSSLK